MKIKSILLSNGDDIREFGVDSDIPDGDWKVIWVTFSNGKFVSW